jgi:hypothetical protein
VAKAVDNAALVVAVAALAGAGELGVAGSHGRAVGAAATQGATVAGRAVGGRRRVLGPCQRRRRLQVRCTRTLLEFRQGNSSSPAPPYPLPTNPPTHSPIHPPTHPQTLSQVARQPLGVSRAETRLGFLRHEWTGATAPAAGGGGGSAIGTRA